MFKDLKFSLIGEFHFNCLNNNKWSKGNFHEVVDVWKFIQLNHQYNTFLWNEEDKARRVDVGDHLIAENKRAIDIYNQKRNNMIEEIDVIILSRIPENHIFQKDAWVNSETAGSIIDRMSINSLKCFHMEIQTKRDADKNHIYDCKRKLEQLKIQGVYLCEAIDHLLLGIENGSALYKIYRQFKMYNDKNLNPYLYASTK